MGTRCPWWAAGNRGVWGHFKCPGLAESGQELGGTQGESGHQGPIPGCLKHSTSALNPQGFRATLHSQGQGLVEKPRTT